MSERSGTRGPGGPGGPGRTGGRDLTRGSIVGALVALAVIIEGGYRLTKREIRLHD